MGSLMKQKKMEVGKLDKLKEEVIAIVSTLLQEIDISTRCLTYVHTCDLGLIQLSTVCVTYIYFLVRVDGILDVLYNVENNYYLIMNNGGRVN